MPNSQVIINPPSPLALVDDAQYGSLKPSTQWRNELFLQPGDWIPWVGAAVVITVLLLGGVVVMLGEKEKVCDSRRSSGLTSRREKTREKDVERYTALTSKRCSLMYIITSICQGSSRASADAVLDAAT